MKFKIDISKVDNYKMFLRRAGYALIYDRRRGVESFVRRLGEGHYPRLHLYVDNFDDKFVFSLHLDQKKASYQGFNMHNAEYDNEIVAQEISRLKKILGYSDDYISGQEDILKNKNNNNNNDPINIDKVDDDPIDRVSSGNLDEDIIRMNNNKKIKKFWFF